MRVLHIPNNIASRPSHTVRSLRKAGVDASGLIFNNSPIQSADGLKTIKPINKSKLASYFAKLYWLMQMIGRLKNVDIVHWYYGRSLLPIPLDLYAIKLLKVPAIVEFTGSDIRNPDWEMAENPYYRAIYDNGYEYRGTESAYKSIRTQNRFAKAGFDCGCDRGMMQYIQKDVFPSPYWLPRRIITADYTPTYPNPNNKRPLVVHSPSKPVTKGTPVIQKVVESLQERYDFDFRPIQNMPRKEALSITQNADIFIDQMVLGDYGTATLEAMALGKPVICFIKPKLDAVYGPQLPIVRAQQENLADVLADLLEDGVKRQAIGRMSRQWVEENADMDRIAHRLIEVYEDLLQKAGN